MVEDGESMAELNIKNEQTHDLARRLTELTGESLTEAVTTSLRERLARLERPDAATRRRRIEVIAERAGPLFREPYLSQDHGNLLYDDAGFPK
ncbi:MAG: hypothetical protein AVDCRST_MAG87-2369 [uncultured Thermomicrobiales bacterium]|uniref:Transcription factor n=1 Tax=uncultured Thermomicrobiales bacterium TaxID=1645740 RepID=A0A6J4V8Z6_9BACT|nr:MAG: hypothetical protein AVDCRST_MAG87-2369 [uncultured Thermomicrobiales bacterium]